MRGMRAPCFVAAAMATLLLVPSCRLMPAIDPPINATLPPADTTTPDGPDEPGEPLGAFEPCETLRVAGRHTPGCSGFSSLTTAEMLAFREVLGHPQADGHFESLVTETTTAGQLYGLSGVHFTDPAVLSALAEAHLALDDSIEAERGCVVGSERVGDIVEGIRSGASPKALRDWDCN